MKAAELREAITVLRKRLADGKDFSHAHEGEDFATVLAAAEAWADSKRYFLDRDNSAHWYLVDESKRAEWEAWTNLDEDDERSWEAPDFARRLNTAPGFVTFTDPKGGE